MDEIYVSRPNSWGTHPTPIVIRAAKLVASEGRSALDLGAGQGRDSLYLARQGFQVTALDKSTVGLEQIKQRNDQVEIVDLDVVNYDFPQEFDLIVSVNTLHFLEKPDIRVVVEKTKRSLTNGGVVAISVLLDNGKLQPGELENLFGDLEVVVYKEFEKLDKPHSGDERPHAHQMAVIIARKS